MQVPGYSIINYLAIYLLLFILLADNASDQCQLIHSKTAGTIMLDSAYGVLCVDGSPL
jgi:hypothetical protein